MPRSRSTKTCSARTARRLALEQLESRAMLSASPRLIDVDQRIVGGYPPDNFLQVGPTFYFSADDRIAGVELWKSDGTSAGTMRLKDINPGTVSSELTSFFAIGQTLYFTANKDADSTELWRSDGTEQGTVKVTDIGLPRFDTRRYFTVLGDYAYFAVGVGGVSSLWRTDGTTQGTIALKESLKDPFGFNLAILGDDLYFAVESASADELWRTDGTVGGTQLVKALAKDDYTLSYHAVVGDALYFVAGDATAGTELWKTDGTATGTVLFKDVVPGLISSRPQLLTNVAGTLYFAADINGYEIWKSDGAVDGTVLVEHIEPPDAEFFAPRQFFAVGNRLVFTLDASDGDDLWVSDGTAAGTMLLREGYVFAGVDSTTPSFAVIGNELYFAARLTSDSGSRDLWRTDGTIAGTQRVREEPGLSSLSPWTLGAFNGELVFGGVLTAQRWQLLKIDGASGSPVLFKDISHATLSSEPWQFTQVGDDVYFITRSYPNYELWRTDGTQGGSTRVAVLNTTYTSTSPAELTAVGGKLFFVAPDDQAYKLWVSDGTTQGTRAVANVSTVIGGSIGSNRLTAFNGEVYYYSGSSSFIEVWKSNGTPEGTVRLTRGRGSARLYPMRELGGKLYFVATDAAGAELWTTDGTVAGTTPVKDINPGTASGAPENLTLFDGLLYFSATDALHGRELWKSDGTEAGTVLVADFSPGGTFSSVGPNAGPMAAMGNRLYYASGTLYAFDSDASTITRILTAASGLSPTQLTPVGDTLYFTARATSSSSVRSLWKTDGTEIGTSIVATNTSSVEITELTSFNGELYFAMSRAGLGNELWKTDGTPAGTVLVADLNLGPSDSAPADLTVIDGALYFSADDVFHGEELWIIDPLSPQGDFDGDRRVSGTDFLLWQRQLGAAGPGLAADHDRNAVVNAADLAPWRTNLGQAVIRPGDFDGDRRTNGNDFLLWQRQLGATGTTLAADSDGNHVVNGADLAPWRTGSSSQAAAAVAVVAETGEASSPTLTHAAAADLALAEFQFAQASTRPAYRPRAAARVR